ncbi:hypothetical protein [Rufibacter hautae]|uniref:Uncharacterized protein n=1 Tax=Rufibacter hautae TaxID=2595005 RepID=A0A5B6TA21_9BACT|nr:hypothetical protein [Rufibacter hautae]KAA3436727.1 hypothetical protein FOA19_20325 [Rufibacter hautae]
MKEERKSRGDKTNEMFYKRLNDNDLVVIAKSKDGEYKCCYGSNCMCSQMLSDIKLVERVVYRSIRKKRLCFRYIRVEKGEGYGVHIEKFDIRLMDICMSQESDLEFNHAGYDALLRKWKINTVVGKKQSKVKETTN